MAKITKISRTYRISPELDRRIKAIVEKADLSEAYFIETAIRNYVSYWEDGMKRKELENQQLENKNGQDKNPNQF